MKTLFTLALASLALASTAQASSYDVNCSNADASVRSVRGHRENFVSITERNWNTGEDSVIKDESGELFNVNVAGGVNLKEEVNNGQCHNGTRGYMRRTWNTEELTITKADGSLFSKNTLDVTPDLTAVKTIVVCESVTTSIMPCGK